MSTLADIAQDLLDFAVAALGATAPARRFLAAGVVAYDCEQISVSLVPPGMYPASEAWPAASAQIGKRPQVTAADYLVELIRCVPNINSETGEFPSPIDLTASAIQIMTDGETLYCAFAAAAQAGTLFGGCRLTSFKGVTPYGPSGGLGGNRVPLTVQAGCEPPGS